MINANNRDNKKNKILVTIIIVLVIIIFLLLFKEYSKNDKNIFHKGKVNIIEITCDTNCNCECEKCDNNNTKDKENDTNINDKTKEVIKEVDDDTNTEVDIKVLDDKKTWKDKEQLSIFKDSSYVVNGKIAPESSGTYEFIIKNSTKYNVKYDVTFSEINDYHITMKYKLKKNNEYIISDWITYSKLAQSNIKLNTNSSDTYYLEWKWFNN